MVSQNLRQENLRQRKTPQQPTPNDSFVKAQPGVTDDDLSQYFKAAEDTSGTKKSAAELMTPDKNGELPIHSAVMATDNTYEVIKAMLDSVDEDTRKKMLLTPDKNGRLPIHRVKNFEMVKAMLEAADPQTRKTMLLTPGGISQALAIHGVNNAETAKVMLEAADSETRKTMLLTADKDGNLPIYLAEMDRNYLLLSIADDMAYKERMENKAKTTKVMLDTADEATKKKMLLSLDENGYMQTYYSGNNSEMLGVIFNVVLDLAVKTKDANLLKLYEKYISADDKELQEKFSSAMGSLQNG